MLWLWRRIDDLVWIWLALIIDDAQHGSDSGELLREYQLKNNCYLNLWRIIFEKLTALKSLKIALTLQHNLNSLLLSSSPLKLKRLAIKDVAEACRQRFHHWTEPCVNCWLLLMQLKRFTVEDIIEVRCSPLKRHDFNSQPKDGLNLSLKRIIMLVTPQFCDSSIDVDVIEEDSKILTAIKDVVEPINWIELVEENSCQRYNSSWS